MSPPDTSFDLTKAEASLRHIEQAMAAFERGLFDVTITLAGAAEGMAPEGTEPSLFPMLRDHPKITAEGMSPKDWIVVLNRERDWLKHAGPTHATSMTFERPAAAMLVRAITKAQAAFGFESEAVETFRAWIKRSPNF